MKNCKCPELGPLTLLELGTCRQYQKSFSVRTLHQLSILRMKVVVAFCLLTAVTVGQPELRDRFVAVEKEGTVSFVVRVSESSGGQEDPLHKGYDAIDPTKNDWT